MPSVVSLGLAFVAGAGLGLLHFGGLWFTVRCLPRVRQPGLITIGSAVGRIAVSLVGFYLVMRAGGLYLLVCLGGFMGVRTFLLHGWRSRRIRFPGE
jgi:F1F0 ATPase subunit 2